MAKTEKPKAQRKRSKSVKTPKTKPNIRKSLGEMVVVKHVKEKKNFLQYFTQLPIQKLAAASIGRDEDTIVRWKKEDRYFADQIEAAKAVWALSKVGQVRSVEWLLERIMKDHFSEKKELDLGVSKGLDEALDRISSILPDAGTQNPRKA